MNPFLLLTLSAAVSMLVIPLIWRFAPRLGLVDMPDPRKVHTTPVPRVGGWGITIGCLVPLLLAFRPDPLLLSYVLGAATLFVFGVWDDARELGHWPKFAGQLLATGLVVFYGDLYVTRMPFMADALPAAVGRAFTLFALIGVVNAINHSDGLDGLAGGETILSLIAFAILGHLANNALVVAVALAGIGGVIGFLRYNSHPARVFMGDCGSQVLGFTLGFLAVYLTQIGNTAVSAALPLLVIGMPIADILAVLFQRIRGGMNWFRATRNHVHHRLLQLGFDHFETVVIIYSLQALLVIAAVLLRYQSDFIVAPFYLLIVGALFAALTLAERRAWIVPRSVQGVSRLSRWLDALAAREDLRRVPLAVMVVLTPAALLFGASWPAHVPRDLGMAAALLALAVGAGLLVARLGGSMLLRLALYVASILASYLIFRFPGPNAGLLWPGIIVTIVLLAVAIALHVRFATDQTFGTNPTDYLIAFGLLALVIFGGNDVNARAVVDVVLGATVLMYACEIIIDRRRPRGILQTAALLALLVIAYRGLR
jgi:UDP-GlcNAc:undecaprenyl-phosphate GlcNAc-1-phosphate transferase